MLTLRGRAAVSLTVLMLAGGCDVPTVSAPPETPGETGTRRAGGLVEITLTNLGETHPRASARTIAGPGGSSA